MSAPNICPRCGAKVKVVTNGTEWLAFCGSPEDSGCDFIRGSGPEGMALISRLAREEGVKGRFVTMPKPKPKD